MESGNRFSDDGVPSLCVDGCGFYANPDKQNRCSACFKKLQNKQQATPPIKSAILKEEDAAIRKEEEEEQPRKKKRCETCKRKVGLLGFECRCGKVLCRSHRHPVEHSCTFEFKELDRQVLVKNNPLVRADKLEFRI